MDMPIYTDFQDQIDDQMTPPYADQLVDTLLFLRTQTRMVVLGDTNHEHPDLSFFLSSRTHLKRLGNSDGFNHLFLECQNSSQGLYDALRNGTCPTGEKDCLCQNSHLHACDKNMVERRLRNTLHNLHTPKIIAADCRKHEQRNKLWDRLFDKHKYDLSFLNTVGERIQKLILDDFRTACGIITTMKSPAHAGLLVYGDGHFCGWGEALGVPSLHQCLTRAKMDPLRVSLHLSQKHKKGINEQLMRMAQKHYRAADIDFVVGDDGKTPGLIFNNAALVEPFRHFRTTTAPNLPLPCLP